MCQDCDKEVINMDIRESDLPNLPYTPVHWFCIVPNCNCKTTVRDYGIAPIYWWPVKITRKERNTYEWEEDGTWKGGRKIQVWRGGWATALHGYICSKHWDEMKKTGWNKWHQEQLPATRELANEYLLTKIKPITKKKKRGYL